ncbi:MAG: dephospho-CoA kinase [Sandaracinaceae bacterium]
MGFGVVGLTGGIASGKSTVAGFFRDLGVPVVDADQVAREVVEVGSEGLAEVVAAFGEDVLRADGSLDRDALGARVFGDPEARRRLEGILHPRIGARSLEQLRDLAVAGHTYAIYEAALLVETGRHETMAALVGVAASPEVQVARLQARDGLDRAAAVARLDAQLPVADKIAVADHVIWNDGDLDETRARTEEVHRALTGRFEDG